MSTAALSSAAPQADPEPPADGGDLKEWAGGDQLEAAVPNWRQLAASTAELLAAALGLGSVDRSDSAEVY